METIITENWNIFLDYFRDQEKDDYYTEEYVKLYETDKSEAKCIICCENNKILMMPFIRQEIDGYFDFETAYGYGGPISNTKDIGWICRALSEMERLFEQEKYVCGFIRFHPLIGNAELCAQNMQVIFDRNTISMNTAEQEDIIWWKQITSKNRNMIRKAEKNGLAYKVEYDFSSLPEFIRLYNATMERLKADDFYYFSDAYYRHFTERLKNKAFLGTVRKEGELICAALFMYSKDYGHYHLEGSNYEYANLAANNLLLWETARVFHRMGIKEFHLGGGYNSEPDNSLLKFKKAFSNNVKDFKIGKWIFNQQKYDELRNNWIIRNPNKIEKYGQLLLCYRY